MKVVCSVCAHTISIPKYREEVICEPCGTEYSVDAEAYKKVKKLRRLEAVITVLDAPYQMLLHQVALPVSKFLQLAFYASATQVALPVLFLGVIGLTFHRISYANLFGAAYIGYWFWIGLPQEMLRGCLSEGNRIFIEYYGRTFALINTVLLFLLWVMLVVYTFSWITMMGALLAVCPDVPLPPKRELLPTEG